MTGIPPPPDTVTKTLDEISGLIASASTIRVGLGLGTTLR